MRHYVLEGNDRTGKTYAGKFLEKYLTEKGLLVKYVRTVGFDGSSDIIREIYVNGELNESKKFLISYLHIAVSEYIKSLIKENYIVLQDRGLASFYVNNVNIYNQYKGSELFNLILEDPSFKKPDIMLYFKSNEHNLIERAESRKNNDLDVIGHEEIINDNILKNKYYEEYIRDKVGPFTDKNEKYYYTIENNFCIEIFEKELELFAHRIIKDYI